jgi:hypothetical protein
LTHHVEFGCTIHRANHKSERQVQKIAIFLFRFLTSNAIKILLPPFILPRSCGFDLHCKTP